VDPEARLLHVIHVEELNRLSVTDPLLESAAREFADATADPPSLFDLSIADGRRHLAGQGTWRPNGFRDEASGRAERRPGRPPRLAGHGVRL
jgi:hypothetical protein